MGLRLFKIDAFTDHVFAGNPACVVPLDSWIDDELMLRIAAENAVAETAYFVQNNDRYHLRWFTPEIEMDLCGHATLAAAHCIKTHLDTSKDEIVFDSASGELRVKCADGKYTLDFPSRSPEPAQPLKPILDSLNLKPLEVLKSRDYVLVYGSEQEIRDIQVDQGILDQINLDPGGVIVTAPGDEADFVSRFFTPQSSILEDPVTGSAHCSLIPFWADRLGRSDLVAHQISARGGVLHCTLADDRVLIQGQAITFLEGTIDI